jgi:hypothetical protein
MAKKGKVEGNYPVGYGKPPTEKQFTSGKSGNPRGRPRGRLNLRTIVGKALAKRVTLPNGRRVSKGELLIEQVSNKAASGNLRAAQLMLSHRDLIPGGESGGAVGGGGPPGESLFSGMSAEAVTLILIVVFQYRNPEEFKFRQRYYLERLINEGRIPTNEQRAMLSRLVFQLIFLPEDVESAVKEIESERKDKK